jgi:predicted RNA binding protein YcfA (HicA-like mRNA interferase family)
VPRLPRVTAKDVVRALLKAGFQIFDREGSHVYLHKRIGDTFGPRVTVPMHSGKILKPKTLKSIIKASKFTVDDFITLL